MLSVSNVAAKPQLTPPPGPPPSARPRPNPRVRLFAGLAVVLLVVVALGVVVILPTRIAPQSPTAQPPNQASDVSAAATANTKPASAEEAADPVTGPMASDEVSPQRKQTADAVDPAVAGVPAAPVEVARPAFAVDQQSADSRRKVAAEAALREALLRQVRLENMGVAVWGAQRLKTSFAKVQATLVRAEAEFAAGRYEAAAEQYRDAVRDLDTLEASRPARLRAALANGRAALASEGAESAVEAFELALALDPGNAEATAGVERARQRPAALAELESGRALETAGKLESASAAYAAALAIEADFAPARSAAEQLAERIRKQGFRAAIAKAETAADAGRFDTARRALSNARALEPRSAQVAGLERRLSAAIKLARLAALRESATELEAAERWDEAVTAYDAALRLDDRASFAVRGRARAENFAALHRQIETYLTKPARLQSADPLARARKVLGAAERIREAGPRLRRERAQLADLVAVADQPVEVVLRSDGQTEITILKVQRLGVFNKHVLSLRPGVYTALGTRVGYRDVRVRVEVSPRAAGVAVDIRCEETI